MTYIATYINMLDNYNIKLLTCNLCICGEFVVWLYFHFGKEHFSFHTIHFGHSLEPPSPL